MRSLLQAVPIGWWAAHLACVLTVFTLAGVLVHARLRGTERPRPGRGAWAWALLPLSFGVGLFVIGFRGYVDAAVAPGDAVQIRATAAHWKWTFDYPNGESAEVLKVPRGRSVQLTLTSRDLVHRFAVPALGLDAEVGPGEERALWFRPRRSGALAVVCGDTCAGGHEQMAAPLEVIDGADFDDFLEGDKKLTPVQLGAKLYAKSTCNTCHSTDGKPGTGPSFKGLFGRHETLADGNTLVVDEAYIRESILEPTAKVVKGFQPVMPVFKGQLDDRQIEGLLAFIKDQKP